MAPHIAIHRPPIPAQPTASPRETLGNALKTLSACLLVFAVVYLSSFASTL